MKTIRGALGMDPQPQQMQRLSSGVYRNAQGQLANQAGMRINAQGKVIRPPAVHNDMARGVGAGLAGGVAPTNSSPAPVAGGVGQAASNQYFGSPAPSQVFTGGSQGFNENDAQSGGGSVNIMGQSSPPSNQGWVESSPGRGDWSNPGMMAQQQQFAMQNGYNQGVPRFGQQSTQYPNGGPPPMQQQSPGGMQFQGYNGFPQQQPLNVNNMTQQQRNPNYLQGR